MKSDRDIIRQVTAMVAREPSAAPILADDGTVLARPNLIATIAGMLMDLHALRDIARSQAEELARAEARCRELERPTVASYPTLPR
jgi:hypothetical protein